MEILYFAGNVLALIVIGLFFYAWFRLRQKVHVHIEPFEGAVPKGPTPKTHYVFNPQGLKIAYWYHPVPHSKATVILIHGYGIRGGKSRLRDHATYLNGAGYSTVSMDLRGFGESDGNKITLGVHEWRDIEAVYDHFMSQEDTQSQKIGYLGIAMGGYAALTLSGLTGKGDFVIACAPYANFDSLFEYQSRHAGLPTAVFVPFMKAAALIEFGTGYNENSADKVIGNINVPLFIICAKRDEEINALDAFALFNAANDPKEFWEADSPHDIPLYHPEDFNRQVKGFLTKHIT